MKTNIARSPPVHHMLSAPLKPSIKISPTYFLKSRSWSGAPIFLFNLLTGTHASQGGDVGNDTACNAARRSARQTPSLQSHPSDSTAGDLLGGRAADDPRARERIVHPRLINAGSYRDDAKKSLPD